MHTPNRSSPSAQISQGAGSALLEPSTSSPKVALTLTEAQRHSGQVFACRRWNDKHDGSALVRAGGVSADDDHEPLWMFLAFVLRRHPEIRPSSTMKTPPLRGGIFTRRHRAQLR